MSSPTPPPIPRKALRVPVQPPSANTKEWLFRLLVAVLLIGAFSLVGWSFFRKLLPLQQQSRDLGMQVVRVSADVDEMLRKLEKSDFVQVERNFSRINTHLFSDETALASWLAELNEQTIPLALELKANFGAAVVPSTNHQNLAVIPTTVTVGIAREIEAIRSPYQRLLRLSHHLASRERRADLTELMVMGGTNSFQQATLVLNLWAGRESAE
jgi:hypothetical protein